MKTAARQLRHRRVRATISGTADRPRLLVFRGSRTMAAQLIDDDAAQTVLTVRGQATAAAAATLGTELAKAAKAKKITAAVFDRAGYRYHGLVKALAEAAREGGLRV